MKLGIFAVPDATDASTTIEQIVAADPRDSTSSREDVAPRVRERVAE